MVFLFQKHKNDIIFKKNQADIFDNFSSRITDSAKKYFITKANELISTNYNSIPASLYMDFLRTGNRVKFEKIYFEKRRILNTLVLGKMSEESHRFDDDIINGIFSICEESGWQIPAHNSYKRDEKQLILPDKSRPVLDLFACESGAQLAVIYHLFKDFDEISPLIRKRIYDELIQRIITPYLSSHFWWMGNGEEEMCNWTIWCTQNILITAYFLELSSDIIAKIIDKALYSIDAFLKDYGTDGSCNEGAMYYHHAGLCLDITTILLNAFTNNAFTDIFEEPLIRNIANYIANVHVSGNYYLNYADCSPILEPAGIREFLFGKDISSLSLMSLAASSFYESRKEPDKHYLSDEINLFYRIFTAIYEKEALDFAKESNKTIAPHNVFYESTGIFVARNNQILVSAKAGHNGDSHNHNDSGSIILYVNNKPVFIDVGVESYTKKTFSNKRYEIWTMQSGFHNLPTIADSDELAGIDYKVSDIDVTLGQGNEISKIQMNLKNAYPDTVFLDYYIRTVTFNPTAESKVVIHDSWDFKQNALNTNVILNFMTYEKPEISENILKIGELCLFEFTQASAKITEIKIEDERLAKSWKHSIYKICFKPKENFFTLKLLFCFI